jgi:hypothetical protein
MAHCATHNSPQIPTCRKEPFGRELMEQVASKLTKEGYHGYHGGLRYTHRDFCGHGLVFRPRGYDLEDNHPVYSLCTVNDGFWTKDILGMWGSKEDFVSFWSRQSDWSCSGFDETTFLFFEKEESLAARGNQRITRDRLQRYLKAANSTGGGGC